MITVVENRTRAICHGGQRHGQTTVIRRIVANHRTPLAQTKAVCQSRKSSTGQSPSLNWNSVCAQNRHPMGIPSTRNGLWLRDDMLATPSGLAKRRDMGQNPRGLAEQIAESRTNRFFPCSSGFLLCTSRFCVSKTGPNPTDRRKLFSKHHIITDAEVVPLSTTLTVANRNDVTQLLP